MKFNSLMSIIVLGVTAGAVLAQQSTKAQTNAPASKLRMLVKSGSAGGAMPTEEEIQAFVSDYKETENSKESLSLGVRFAVPKLAPEQRKKFERTKKVPYQLTVDLAKTKEINGKKMALRVTDGKCNFAILDENGKVIKQSSENLIKLCAS
ncbi:MAG: hypothetical protein WCP12_11165 [bacterium]